MIEPWSVWLIPCVKDMVKYQALIRDCCRRSSVPYFTPHLTLFGRLNINPESTFQFFDEFINSYPPLLLNQRGLNKGQPPWKSLFVDIEYCSVLTEMQKKIKNRFRLIRDYTFDPHLSIGYGNIKMSQKEIDDISLDDSIMFSSVALVLTPDRIDRWRSIRTYKLVE